MMRSTLLTIALSALTYSTYAQDATTTTDDLPKVPLKNEIGTIGSTTFGNASTDFDFVGVQYKHWVKPNYAYRIIGGYGNHSDFISRNITSVSNNGYTETTSYADIPTVYGGIGVETHRQFYKRVYLFAAIDLLGSYGSGTAHQYTTTYERESGTGSFVPVGIPTNLNYTVSQFSINVMPSIGAKFQFNRISFGTEICPIRTGLVVENSSRTFNNVATIDMYAGDLIQRFFVNFRF